MKKNLSILLSCLVLLISCTSKKAELGSADNPINLFFVPSVDAKLIADSSKLVKKYLEENTPYKYKIGIPASFVAVVEAFGTRRADIAAINTFGYIMANEKYGAQARITLIRHGNSKYRSQIISRSDSKIRSIKDLNGKKFAYVDPASTSGYLLPAKLFVDNHVQPKETVFAQKHDNVVTMVYQKQVDAGATFYSPPSDGGKKLEDARRLVLTQYPNIEKEVSIIQLTDEIPNDPIMFRKELPEEMKTKVTDSLLAYIHTPEGKKVFGDMYGADSFIKTSDAEYDNVRSMLKALGTSAASLVK